jgi:predicted RNA binding protein YcfA (HicA-like mRNA interferase family)
MFSRSPCDLVVKMKVRDVPKRLRRDGWHLEEIEGDHRQFKHTVMPGKVTVAGHPGEDIPIGTLKSIYKQAGWED